MYSHFRCKFETTFPIENLIRSNIRLMHGAVTWIRNVKIPKPGFPDHYMPYHELGSDELILDNQKQKKEADMF